MLHLVEIANEAGDLLSLPLGDSSNGIILTGMDGLDPGKATLIASDYAQQDGAVFHSARRESRNILMGFNLDSRFGGESARSLRQRLYEYLMPKSKVELTLYLEDNLNVKINGVVESIQSPMFTQKPVAVASIICHDPDFYDPTILTKTGEAYSTGVAEYPVFYTGTVPTGIELTLYVNAGVTSDGFEVHHRKPNGEVDKLSFSAPLQGYDDVRINTNPGQKSATLIRNGAETNILAGIDPTSSWIQLVPGENHIAVTVTGDQFYYEYTFFRKFGGL